MKGMLILLVANLLSIVLGVGAIYMAVNGINGWGWFLAIAALGAVNTVKFKSEE